ncbi:MAG: biopolymer transporter ExbD [Deltaproteobacteria bacterium]|nr:biopolymer transporter ExbD [Deltaproteobacteria bacterium]MBI4374653.1 biopolymer transporter ExbD [Deltaproteobacteria bacterium]
MAVSNRVGEDEMISGINITPLVDVVLVLLIIFMITAPVIYQSALKVRLARATTGESLKEREVDVTITQSGNLIWNGRPTDWKGLEQELRNLGEGISEKTAVINADRDTPHGTVVQLMDLLRAAGLTHLALNVERVSKPDTSGE